jgi:hypothetical protein
MCDRCHKLNNLARSSTSYNETERREFRSIRKCGLHSLVRCCCLVETSQAAEVACLARISLAYIRPDCLSSVEKWFGKENFHSTPRWGITNNALADTIRIVSGRRGFAKGAQSSSLIWDEQLVLTLNDVMKLPSRPSKRCTTIRNASL